jgi:accessory colonization factor AcfC
MLRRALAMLSAAAATAAAAWHAVHAVQAWAGWQEWRRSDPSLADFFWTEMELEIGLVVLLAIAAAVFFWLRRAPQPSAVEGPDPIANRP